MLLNLNGHYEIKFVWNWIKLLAKLDKNELKYYW